MSQSNIDNNNNWIPQPSTNILKPPHIIDYSPIQGQAGDPFRIDIQQHDLAVDIQLLKIAFNSCFTTCQFSLNTVTQVVSIHTQVPNSNSINFDLSKVPIYLAVVQGQTIIDSWLIGYFSYFTRKRHSSDLDHETKRPRSDQFQNYYVSVPYVGLPPTEPSARPNEYFQDPLLNFPANPTAFSEPSFIPARPSVLVPEQQQFMKPIQPIQAPLSTHSSPPPPTNPFTNLVHKPNLILEGDLSSMSLNWTNTELSNGRRLVQFWRRQEGNDIICRFEPFNQPLNTDTSKLILVSCIRWQNEFYVTSVDCISLLERLIGVKFTVEEKNRIRRNLEEYKPMTVSKLKPESIEFFRLIMGFPSPKPRNIEKGVKVFPWKTLSTALTKIISKYTASYSSTASVTTL